jgi:predicted DNA binding CopG/RHH family protein
VKTVPKTDAYEARLIEAYDKGSLKSVATKSELSKFKAAARATAIKDRRVNIRLSSGDLQDIQVKALEEGLPYQTLIASVLHKYVTGRLAERESGPKTSLLPQNSLPQRASKTDA